MLYKSRTSSLSRICCVLLCGRDSRELPQNRVTAYRTDWNCELNIKSIIIIPCTIIRASSAGRPNRNFTVTAAYSVSVSLGWTCSYLYKDFTHHRHVITIFKLFRRVKKNAILLCFLFPISFLNRCSRAFSFVQGFKC